MPYIITELCTRDGACVEVCPVSCIHTTPDAAQFYVDPDICIECEQCEIVCPVDAIFLDIKLPEEHYDSIEVNAAFFRQNKAVLGPPPLEVAWHMVSAAQTYAERNGIAVAIAVVDKEGAPIAATRMSGAAPFASELALNKAYTSTYFHVGTHELAAQARRPLIKALTVANHGRIVPVAGALPIVNGIDVLGAIAVAGGPNDEADMQCVRAGLNAMEEHDH
jgi:ferredoxin